MQKGFNMKHTLNTLFILFLFVTYSCKAQQMVQVPEDAMSLKKNEQQFLNKPLKNLLNQIKPEIKTGSLANDFPSYFYFKFTTPVENYKTNIGQRVISLVVYVKEESIDWDSDKRFKTKYLWTTEDSEKYGNLTVIRIKVIDFVEE